MMSRLEPKNIYYIEIDEHLNIMHWERHNGTKANPLEYIMELHKQGCCQIVRGITDRGFLITLDYDWVKSDYHAEVRDMVRLLKKKIRHKRIMKEYIHKL